MLQLRWREKLVRQQGIRSGRLERKDVCWNVNRENAIELAGTLRMSVVVKAAPGKVNVVRGVITAQAGAEKISEVVETVVLAEVVVAVVVAPLIEVMTVATVGIVEAEATGIEVEVEIGDAEAEALRRQLKKEKCQIKRRANVRSIML